MRKKHFLVLVFFSLLVQSKLMSQTEKGVYVGFSDTLHSAILNQDRLIQYYLPGNYTTTQEHYPVMFLCDGQWNFIHTLGILGFMAGNGRAPQMILVSIYHTNRDDDLVPKSQQSSDYSGKADLFLDFIQKELIPYVDEHYRTQSFRILTGISYGGLFTNYTMILRPDLFDAYISIDPSLWWDGSRIIHDSESLFKSLDSFNKVIYFTQSEIPGMGSDRFAQMLFRSAPRGLKWKFNHMRLESHGSITHRSIYDGLEFIFSDWSADPVQFTPAGGIFRKGDSLAIQLAHPTAFEIHYTMDGTEPTSTSPVYEKALVITKPCVLKTKPFFGYGITGGCDSVRYEYAVMHRADTKAKGLKKGLTYRLYEGDWDKLPDFEGLSATTTGVADSINVGYASLQDHFGLVFQGYLDVKEEGIYTFYLQSDDGSRFLIGGEELINLDGLHGVSEGTGQILLGKGKHAICVEYFEKGGGEFLQLEYEGPGIERTQIPSGLLYHAN